MSEFPAAVPNLPQLTSFSQDDILRLFDRILPDHYLLPLKDPGPGYEYLQAVAAMIARVSEGVAHTGSGCYIGSATGGSYSTVQVQLYRDTAYFGPCTLLGNEYSKQGTLVGTADGYYYQLLENVNFSSTDLGPYTVTAQAVARGWLWNRPGPFTTADGEYVPGAIDRLIKPVFPLSPSPPNFDPTIKVRQVSAATGGSAPMLDAIGNDRGIPRNFAGITSATLTRTNTNPIVLLAGSVFSTDAEYHYKTTADIQFLSGELGPKLVAVEPLFLDVPASMLPLSSIITPLWGTPETDSSLDVSSATPTVEEDIPYRTRMSLLPKTVTPSSIQQALTQLLAQIPDPWPKTFDYREIWDLRYQTAYDFPINQTLTLANTSVTVPAFNGNIFVYDLENADALSNRYLSGNPERGVILIRLPVLTQELRAQFYPAIVNNIEQIKPAGATVVYILAG